MGNVSIFNSSLSTKRAAEISGLVRYLGVFLVVLCLVVTIIGDCLVYVAFYTKRNVRTQLNVFFLSLTSADICIAFLVMPLELVHLTYEPVWPLGTTVAKLWNSFFVCLGTASVCSLAAISIERYLAITRPLRHQTATISKEPLLGVLFVWLYAVISAIYSFFIWSNSLNPLDPGFYIPVSHAIIMLVADLLLPFTVCVVLYFRIFQISLRHSSRIAVMCTLNVGGHRKSLIREKKSAKTLSLLVGTFAFSSLPFFVFHAIDTAYKETLPGRSNASHIVKWFCYVNSASNWALYGFLDHNFRAALLSVVRTYWRHLKLFHNRIVPLNNSATQIAQNSVQLV